METRKANMIFGKAGGNASRNAYTCKVSVPKTWVDRMGLSPVAYNFIGCGGNSLYRAYMRA